MGKVCTKSANRHEADEDRIIGRTAQLNIPQPVIISIEDVLLIDFTREAFGEETLEGLKKHLANYQPVDIRCSRERPIELKAEEVKSRPHSFISVVGRLGTDSEFTQMGLEVDFFPTSTQVCIGPEDTLQRYLGRKSPFPEHFFFAEDQAVSAKGFHQILDWVQEHRYKKLVELRAEDSEEQNLGKQLYDYILSFYQ